MKSVLKKKQIILLLSLSFIILTNCQKDNLIISSKFEYQYFPLKQGNELIYKISKIQIDKPVNLYDTSIYYIKEVIDSCYVDNEQDTAYRIERYKSNLSNSSWVIDAVWNGKITEYTAQKVEDNLRIVKLRFPLKLNKKWNINIYNELEAQTAYINSKNYLFNNQLLQTDDCINVILDSSSSLIHLKKSNEVYAKDIGLIYKENIDIKSQEVQINIPIENRITICNIYKQELIDYKTIN